MGVKVVHPHYIRKLTMGVSFVRNHLIEAGHQVLTRGSIKTDLPHVFVEYGGLRLTPSGPRGRVAVTVVSASLDENDPSLRTESAAHSVWLSLTALRGWVPRSAGPVELIDDNAFGYGVVMFGSVIELEEAG